MKRVIIILLALWGYTLHAQQKSYTVANAHSHNDYEQPTPSWTAYNEGFGSIEADIFLHLILYWWRTGLMSCHYTAAWNNITWSHWLPALKRTMGMCLQIKKGNYSY